MCMLMYTIHTFTGSTCIIRGRKQSIVQIAVKVHTLYYTVKHLHVIPKRTHLAYLGPRTGLYNSPKKETTINAISVNCDCTAYVFNW